MQEIYSSVIYRLFTRHNVFNNCCYLSIQKSKSKKATSAKKKVKNAGFNDLVGCPIL